MDKKFLRKEILMKRSEIDAAYRQRATTRVTDEIIRHVLFEKAKVIASFVAFRDEMDMTEINQTVLAQNKTLVLPYVSMEKHEMSFHVIENLDALVMNHYGLLEPNPLKHDRIDVTKIDLILTPGVAFDLNGYRLGYGGGFYDRLFAQLSKAIPKIGIAFDLQCITELPVEAYDEPITHLVTEKKIYIY